MAGPARLSRARRRPALGALAAPLLVSISTLWAGAGCGRLREKQAVRRYALHTAKVEVAAQRCRALGDELARHRVQTDLARLRPFLRGQLLPRLRVLAEAVRALPGEGARLAALKAQLLSPAERALEAAETLADRVGGGPLESAFERLEEASRALDAAVAAHGKALDALCGEHDLRRHGS